MRDAPTDWAEGIDVGGADGYHAHQYHKPRVGVIVVDQLSAGDEREIRTSLRKITSKYPDEYWMRHDLDHEFAWDFYNEMAESGWIGICIPEEYGGGGAGVQEAALLLEEVTGSGGALNAGTTVQVALFGLEPIVKHGSEEQKQRFLRPAAEGKLQVSFGVTEPDAGTETTNITTFAEKVPGGYKVNGRKVFISRAEQAERLLLITRTAPRDASPKQTDGMTLFFPKMDHDHIKIQPIPKLGRNAVSTTMLFIDDLFIPDEDRIGEEGKGFQYILHGMNPERILIAAECVGLGRVALARAARYAGERIVFGRPIGQNQGIQHPLAERWVELEAAELLVLRAAAAYDAHEDTGQVGAYANAAKYFAGEAGHRACETAMLTHGGMGYAKEFHVERYFREAQIGRIAPVMAQLILSHIGERVLGLPKSY
jgi:acyl-CoA dehydrogenase